jgi:dTDP-4-dehydrorhamnose reductase
MRITILGARGQLGCDLVAALAGDDVTPLGRPDADLTSLASLDAALRPLRPDAVVNCAAYNLVDKAESEPAAALDANAVGVRHLALVCRDLGCVLMHFSTDYVFGLDAGCRTPYRETDAPGPVSVYGTSKLAGETFVRALCPRHFVVRTCGLYGHHGQGGKGGNFVETILKRARAGQPLRVVSDQTCTPTATADLARAAAALVRTDAFGLYHVTSGGQTTWFDFARHIVQIAGLSADLTPITSDAYAAPARRPSYSVLDGAKFAGLRIAEMPPWPDAVATYLAAK